MKAESVTRDWIKERLDTLYPAHVSAFVRLLTELRTMFDGDLDALLILATTSVSLEGEGWRESLFGDQSLNARHKPTNTQSIAYHTQIPRETVRRKLGWLRGMGWVTRDAKGNWTPTRAAAKALEPGTEATVTYLRIILNAALKAKASRDEN